MKFQIHLPKFIVEQPIENDNPWNITTYLVEENIPEPRPIEKKIAMITDRSPIVKPNTFVDPSPVEITTPDAAVPQAVPVIKSTMPDVAPVPVKPSTLKLRDLEQVPIFFGCESAANNEERMACMSEKLTKLIQRKFNTDLAHELGLTGIQQIQVQFKIDTTGHVTDIKTRSPYPQLEKEAERVVNKIPVMIPGMQKNTPVSVLYNLPIAFKVQ